MDEPAIRAIQASSAVTQQISRLVDNAVLVPREYELQSLEHLLNAPLRQRREFTTTRPDDFITYVKSNSNVNTCVYVESTGMQSLAVLNHGTPAAPEWGDDRAKLILKQTQVFAAMCGICGAAMTQQVLIDYLEDWSDVLIPIVTTDEDSNVITMRKAIAAVRRVKIEAKGSKTSEQGDMRATMSAMEEVEASGAVDPLPTILRFRGAPYEGLASYTIDMRVRVLLDNDKPLFKLRLIGIGQLEERISEEITDRIMREVGCTVYVGTSKNLA